MRITEVISHILQYDLPEELGYSQQYYAKRTAHLVEVRTRALSHKDHLCGSEFVYYPPLTEVADAVPAYTEAHAFNGDDFNTTWSCPLKRSAFVGAFTR